MLIENLMKYEFLQYAYISGILISLLFPIFGAFITLRKQIFISDTISHVSLAGISIGYYLTSLLSITFNPTFIGIIAAILGAVIIEYMRSNYKGFKEIVMINVMCISIALAIIFASFSTSKIAFSSFLFGSINTIEKTEFYLLIGLFLISAIFLYKNYYTLLAISIDEEHARLKYKNLNLIKYSFVVLMAILIALSIKIIGALLISAMIVMPVSIVINKTNSFKTSNILSTIIALIATITGLVVSYYISIPSGASIVVILAIIGIVKKIFFRGSL
ncbi:MAG: metal ABC transporter permease [Bacilli bacterium]